MRESVDRDGAIPTHVGESAECHRMLHHGRVIPTHMGNSLANMKKRVIPTYAGKLLWHHETEFGVESSSHT